MKSSYAYVRVSTVRQGEKGTSLSEQRDAIMAFASRHDITILEWFEERETAAKQGRGEFARMMRLLRRRRDHGVIFHKIDRGARNLKDWSNIQDLIETGVSVYFAHESVDMTTRGGRLTADLLAVIASDYIRNLRDEVKKGMRGRLKQGLLPLQAPPGYLDQGGGVAKIPDPIQGPLVRRAFELYASGCHTLESLAREMQRRGLRNKRGKPIDSKRLAKILRQPFYMGLIYVAGAVYAGVHQPLVSKRMFDRVQDALSGKAQARVMRHEFTYRRMIRCAGCGYRLVGELQKGNVYYRCHTRACSTTGIREQAVEMDIGITLSRVSLTEAEAEQIAALAADDRARAAEAAEAAKLALSLQKQQAEARLSRLTDALIDGAVDKTLYETKRAELLLLQAELRDQELRLETDDGDKLDKFLELITDLQTGYILSTPLKKREILKSVTSNLSLCGKNLVITLSSPFQEIENRQIPSLVDLNGTDLELLKFDRTSPSPSDMGEPANDNDIEEIVSRALEDRKGGEVAATDRSVIGRSKNAGWANVDRTNRQRIAERALREWREGEEVWKRRKTS